MIGSGVLGVIAPAEADADVVVDRPPDLLEDEVLEELPPLLPFQEDQDPVMCRTPTLEGANHGLCDRPPCAAPHTTIHRS